MGRKIELTEAEVAVVRQAMNLLEVELEQNNADPVTGQMTRFDRASMQAMKRVNDKLVKASPRLRHVRAGRMNG